MAFNKLNNVWPKIGPRHLLNLYVGGQWYPGTKKSSQNCDWTHNKIQFSHNLSINITQFRTQLSTQLRPGIETLLNCIPYIVCTIGLWISHESDLILVSILPNNKVPVIFLHILHWYLWYYWNRLDLYYVYSIK